MTVAKVRTFKSGNSEAVRLPKDIAFGEDVELVAVRSGDVLTLYRVSMSIPEMLGRLSALPSPRSVEEREEWEGPDRAGLCVSRASRGRRSPGSPRCSPQRDPNARL